MVIGKITKVKNLTKKGNASAYYNCLTIVDQNDSLTHLLLTDAEIKRFTDRAKKNKEGLPELTWKDKLALLVL